MATFVYDDFRVRLTPLEGDVFAVQAVANRTACDGRFRLPLDKPGLERAVVDVARGRDVGATQRAEATAEQLGAALADALFGGAVGAAYDTALSQARHARRGLRLTLTLTAVPALMSLPWELLYRRPVFLARQRRTPIVRHLETGSPADPPSIDRTVRILGVVATPAGLPALDVDAEQDRVCRATAKIVGIGRVELDWLQPATPDRLREALRDNSYHVVHFVGHGGLTGDGAGVLYLERGRDRRAIAVDGAALANLLASQDRLRLVVLNACHGARTTLTDPFAGVAATLIQLGVPAVVAMQFEISDAAAIVFARELYTNLIGRQDSIDAAVAEARNAISVELGERDWATPVLYVRDPDVELFRFRLPPAIPPPLPPEVGEPDASSVFEHGADVDCEAVDPTAPDTAAATIEHGSSTGPLRRLIHRPRWPLAVLGAVAAGGAVIVLRPDPPAAEATVLASPDDTQRADVQAVVDARGDVHVAWDEGFDQAVASRIDDQWRSQTLPRDDWEDGSLLLGPAGEPCLVMHRFSGEPADLPSWGAWEGCRTEDRWQTPRPLINPSDQGLGGISGTTYFSITRTSDGQPHAAWQIYQGSQTAGFGQHTFTTDTGAIMITLVADSDDRLHVLYGQSGVGVEHRVSHDRGATWSRPATINVLPDDSPLGLWDALADEAGNLHLLLGRSGIFNDSSGLWHRQWDTETGWRRPHVVFDDGQRTDQLPAAIAIVGQRPVVAWYPRDGQLQLSRQTDDRSFAIPTPINAAADETIIDVAATTDGDRLHLAWLADDGQVTHLESSQ